MRPDHSTPRRLVLRFRFTLAWLILVLLVMILLAAKGGR
jgi:hypothetical protein